MSRSRVVTVAPDLFFAARIGAVARAAGVELVAGPQLAEACREDPPELIVLDLHGPRDPLAAVRALKADARTRGVPVVGFYSHTDDALRRAALAASVDRVLPRYRAAAGGDILRRRCLPDLHFTTRTEP